jgi:hypothetical protein
MRKRSRRNCCQNQNTFRVKYVASKNRAICKTIHKTRQTREAIDNPTLRRKPMRSVCRVIQTIILSIYCFPLGKRYSGRPGGAIFRTRPDRPWAPSNRLYYRQRVSFPGVERPGRSFDHPPPSSVYVEERVQLSI